MKSSQKLSVRFIKKQHPVTKRYKIIKQTGEWKDDVFRYSRSQVIFKGLTFDRCEEILYKLKS